MWKLALFLRFLKSATICKWYDMMDKNVSNELEIQSQSQLVSCQQQVNNWRVYSDEKQGMSKAIKLPSLIDKQA